MILVRAALGAVALSLLSGCAALLGGVAAPLDAFELRAPPVAQAARATGRSLVIELPEASGALNTDRIMIRPNPLQAQYLPGARWTEAAPVMVQTMLLRAFQDSSALRYVGRRPLGGLGDVVLVSDLTDLQAEIGADGAAVARMRLTARFVRESDAEVLSTRNFEAVVPLASLETIDVVHGLDIASNAVIRDMVAWVLSQIGARPTS